MPLQKHAGVLQINQNLILLVQRWAWRDHYADDSRQGIQTA